MSYTKKSPLSGIGSPFKVISRPSWLRLLAILIVTILFFLLNSCSDKAEKIKPVEEPITESVYASGIIKSNHQYNVYSTVSGVISTVFVEEGALVKKGEPILQLEHAGEQLFTDNAALTARYAAVQANTEKLVELQVSTNLARVKMQEDQLLMERQKILWSENIGTKNELEQRQLAAKSSAAAYESARLRYTQLQKQLNFQSTQSGINLQIATKAGADYTIKSGMEGRVYKIEKKQGEMVNTLSPVAIIGDAAFFHIELQVDEYDINRISKGQEIVVSMDSYKDQLFTARVSVINPIMNESSKSFTVEAIFVKAPASLFPNLTCEANIVIQQKAKAITIPRPYLLEGDSVLLTKNKKIKVQVGLKNYQKAEILKGLTAEEYIFKPAL
jgi:HlyD family secretion protein